MTVLEAPTWHDWPVAGLGPDRYGYLAMFRLDLPASVAPLQDGEASRAAALLPQDWFLGIITVTGALDAHNEKNEALLNFRFSLIGQGLPDPPSASVPLCTSPPTTEDRPAIPLDHSLPWPNLYVHTYHNAVAIISRIHHDTGNLPPRLTKDQISRLRKLEVADSYYRVRAPPDDDNAASSDDGTETDDMLSADARPIFETLERCQFYADLWLDPAGCEGPPAPPRAYPEVVQGIQRIQTEWGDRQLRAAKAKRPALTDEWIRAVHKAQSEEPPASVHSSSRSYSEQALSDEAILPEDAVDYRVEQAMLAQAYILPRTQAPGVMTSEAPRLEGAAPIEHDVAASGGNEPLSSDHGPAVADSIAQLDEGNASTAVHPSAYEGGQP